MSLVGCLAEDLDAAPWICALIAETAGWIVRATEPTLEFRVWNNPGNHVRLKLDRKTFPSEVRPDARLCGNAAKAPPTPLRVREEMQPR